MAKLRGHQIAENDNELSYVRKVDRKSGETSNGRSCYLTTKKFLANPNPIPVTNREELEQSEFLAKERVLRVIRDGTFIMASPLLRSLIMKHITSKLLHCPSTPAPLRQDRGPDMLKVLKTIVPLFNPTDMQNAVYFSYKTALVKVNNASAYTSKSWLVFSKNGSPPFFTKLSANTILRHHW